MTSSSDSAMMNPSYVDFIVQSSHYLVSNFQYFWNGQYTQQKFSHDFAILIKQLNLLDLFVVTALSIGLTLARHYTTKHILQPITKWRGIGAKEAGKIPESAWKLMFYLPTWTMATYLIFGNEDAQYFTHPERVWQNYSVTNPVESGVYALYMIEFSFYIHSLYTTLLVDQRRKDTYTLMFHHIICVLLLAISYCNKTHKSGLLTLFLHDGSDVLLEATKLVRYFKVQHGKTYGQVETVVNIGFAAFLLTWISNRLYWFPIKQVYMASVYVQSQSIEVPFISLLVLMLWVILLMNYYWFSFALRLLYKMFSGQLTELEDNREYKEAEHHKSVPEEDNVPIEMFDDEKRKFSIDSGVMILEDGHDTEETDKSSESSDHDEHSVEEKPKVAPSSPCYNLRQRRGVDFSAYR